MNTRGNHIVHGGLLAKGTARFEKGADIPYFECAEYRPSGTVSHDDGVDDGENDAWIWQKRHLTDETENDTPDFATLDSVNYRVTLPAGEYHIEASAPAWSVGEHQTRLWDFTDAAMIMEGTSAQSDGTQTRSELKGHFTLTQQTVIQIEHIMETVQVNNGFGRDAGFYIDNVYTHMQLWQIRDDS